MQGVSRIPRGVAGAERRDGGVEGRGVAQAGVLVAGGERAGHAAAGARRVKRVRRWHVVPVLLGPHLAGDVDLRPGDVAVHVDAARHHDQPAGVDVAASGGTSATIRPSRSRRRAPRRRCRWPDRRPCRPRCAAWTPRVLLLAGACYVAMRTGSGPTGSRFPPSSCLTRRDRREHLEVARVRRLEGRTQRDRHVVHAVDGAARVDAVGRHGEGHRAPRAWWAFPSGRATMTGSTPGARGPAAGSWRRVAGDDHRRIGLAAASVSTVVYSPGLKRG